VEWRAGDDEVEVPSQSLGTLRSTMQVSVLLALLPLPPHPPSNIGAIVWQFLSEDFGFVNDTCVQVTLFRSLFLTREVGSKLFWNGLTVYRRPGGALYLIISEKAGKIHYSCSETATYTGSGKGIKFNE